jgi:uncharacterized cupredoxin-like copper-binding protein
MKKFAVLLAMLLAAFAIVACGDSDSDTTSDTGATTTEETTEAGGGGGASNELHFEADPNGDLAYTEDSATAEAGKVEVHLTNEAPVPHDVAIEDEGGKTIGKTPVISEDKDSTTVDLKTGEYTFYCSVPGHREAGMEGTLTVE